MLVMWSDTDIDDQRQLTADAEQLDELLDRLHKEGLLSGSANAVQIYAGQRYPEEGHGDESGWIPADPGDGPQPVLFLTVGTDQTPVYWIEADGREHTSKNASDDEPEFEYLYGGQESYAPAWSLIPANQAREAARQFLATGGQRPGNITWRADDAG